MGTGLIYALIVLLWAVVLVPLWLRRHDESNEYRSADRFHRAMRRLDRRSTPVAPASREVLMPARPAEPALPDGAVTAAVGASATHRRRRLVLGLTLVTVALVAAVVLGPVPWWVAAAAGVLTGGAVVGHVAATRREQERVVAARRARARAARARRSLPQASMVAGAPMARRASVGDGAGRVPVAAGVLRRAGVDEVAVARQTDALYDQSADTWEPVPVPLPTYVTAPKAPRSVRTVDLSAPGAWTSGRLVSEKDLVAARGPVVRAVDAPPAEPGEDPGIVVGEVVVERRRAVNE